MFYLSAQTAFGRLRYRFPSHFEMLQSYWSVLQVAFTKHRADIDTLEHAKCCLWALRRPLAAFATYSVHILKYCNPIGQLERLPVAPVGLVSFSNQVDVDLPLGVETIPGKFHRNRLYGVRMHSEQTNRQTDKRTNRQTFSFIDIDLFSTKNKRFDKNFSDEKHDCVWCATHVNTFDCF
jgi:hypothetical protein